MGRLLFVLAIVAHAADVEWPVNGGPYNIRYTTLGEISPANVSRLQVAWAYDAHDAFKDSEMQSNPIVVGGLLYATTPKMRVVALNAETGQEVWSFNPAQSSDPQRRFRHRTYDVCQISAFRRSARRSDSDYYRSSSIPFVCFARWRIPGNPRGGHRSHGGPAARIAVSCAPQ